MQGLKQSIITSLWFMFLTFPIMVVRVNTIENTIEWRWMNLAYVGVGIFILSYVWRWALARKEAKQYETVSTDKPKKQLWISRAME
ncbi:branched-chain amino acid ABC transporter permease, partial [Halodesulfovibrio aestuarii]